MTFQEAFDGIAALMTKKVKFERDFAVEIHLTDSDCGGVFYAAYRNGALEIMPYDYHDHDAKIEASSSDLKALLTGEIKKGEALSVLHIQGDEEAVHELLKLCRRKVSKKAPTAGKKESKNSGKTR